VSSRRSQHRNQHTVQRAYLKRFANGQGKLWQYDKQSGLVTNVAASRATGQPDFYTLRMKNGEESLAWETEVLGRQVEAPAAQSIGRILGSLRDPILDEDRRSLAVWIAMSAMRTTRARDEIDRTVTMELARRFEQSSAPRDLRGRTPEFMSRNPHIVKNFPLLAVRHKVVEVTQEIYRRGWGIVRFEDFELVTSDNPVARYQDAFSKPTDWEEQPLFVLSLCPQVGLLVSRRYLEDYVISPGDEYARWFNAKIVNSAYRFVYHNADDDKQRYFPQLAPEERRALYESP